MAVDTPPLSAPMRRLVIGACALAAFAALAQTYPSPTFQATTLPATSGKAWLNGGTLALS